MLCELLEYIQKTNPNYQVCSSPSATPSAMWLLSNAPGWHFQRRPPHKMKAAVRDEQKKSWVHMASLMFQNEAMLEDEPVLSAR